MPNLPATAPKRKYRLYDNTRLQDMRRCPRYYFYRHIMDWRREGSPSAALAFGGGWHAAMDVMWKLIAEGKPRDEVVEAAMTAFLHYWTVKMEMPEEDMLDDLEKRAMLPRLPSTAFEMLWSYYEARHNAIRRMEIIEIERPFAVPLTPDQPDLFYVGRIDKVVRPLERKSRIRGIEHKTTTASKIMGKSQTKKIRPIFRESFSPNSQVDGYLFSLALLYNCESEVWVDAALVNQTDSDFEFIPIERIGPMLDAWLYTTHWWIDLIDREKEKLATEDAGQPYLQAFPQDTRSCFDFNTQCQYLHLCKSRANPLSFGEEVPPGYVKEHWNPLDHIGTPKEL